MQKLQLPILYLHFRKHLRKSNIEFETGYNNTVTIRLSTTEAIHFQFHAIGEKYPVPYVTISTIPLKTTVSFPANFLARLLLKIDRHKNTFHPFTAKVLTAIAKEAA